MRASSPTTLLLGVVLLCVATALAGVWMALSPAWLGAGFEAKPDGAIVITRLTADGPLARVGAKVGDRLAGVGANTAAPALRSDEIGGLDTPATEASVREKERREDAFAKALSAKPLTLRLAGPPDGQGSAVQRVVTLDDRSRPLSALNPEFWANLSVRPDRRPDLRLGVGAAAARAGHPAVRPDGAVDAGLHLRLGGAFHGRAGHGRPAWSASACG
jgi:hypothetical protein